MLEYATYTWELDATVTALWGSASLLDVKVSKLASWGLDHANLVGLGVVTGRARKSASWSYYYSSSLPVQPTVRLL